MRRVPVAAGTGCTSPIMTNLNVHGRARASIRHNPACMSLVRVHMQTKFAYYLDVQVHVQVFSVAQAIAVSPEFGAADQHDGSEDYNTNCVSDCRDSTMRPGTSRRYVSACKHADAGSIVHACRYYFYMLASYKSWQYNYISKEIICICIIQPCRLDKHYPVHVDLNCS